MVWCYQGVLNLRLLELGRNHELIYSHNIKPAQSRPGVQEPDYFANASAGNGVISY